MRLLSPRVGALPEHYFLRISGDLEVPPPGLRAVLPHRIRLGEPDGAIAASLENVDDVLAVGGGHRARVVPLPVGRILRPGWPEDRRANEHVLIVRGVSGAEDD